MKSIVIALLVCIMQMRSISGDFASAYSEGNFREDLGKMQEISKQFLDDVDEVIKRFKDDAFVMRTLDRMTYIMAECISGPKITTSKVRSYIESYGVNDYPVVDNADILKTILSRELPPERYNGIISLILAFRDGASDEEMDKALEYLYGSATSPPQPNIPALDKMNCSRTEAETEKAWEKEKERKEERQRERDRDSESGLTTEAEPETLTLPQTSAQWYGNLASTTIDSFKEIKDLNPKVIQDLTGIFEKFPCNEWVSIPLERTATMIASTFSGRTAKIDICVVKEKSENLPYWTMTIGKFFKKAEKALSARLPQEKYAGIVDLVTKLRPNATDTEIAQALSYLYGTNVEPKSSC